MPASSIDAINSWGIYLIASAVLVSALLPPLLGAARDSRKGADWRVADGIQHQLDALRPGITLSLSYGSWPSADSVQLDGKEISMDYGNGTVSLPSLWNLPITTLKPSVVYRVWLEGDNVRLNTIG